VLGGWFVVLTVVVTATLASFVVIRRPSGASPGLRILAIIGTGLLGASVALAAQLDLVPDGAEATWIPAAIVVVSAGIVVGALIQASRD
jgi:hypothetical protein